MRLEDVEKHEASLGLLTIGERGEQGTYIRAPGVLVAECHLLGDAALLAHSKNMMRPLVDAVTEAVNEAEQLATAAGRLAEYGPWIDRMRGVIIKAQEVPGI